MQSETLFSLVGKIRVQRIRLAQQAAPTLTCPWTAEESIKFYEVISNKISSLNFTELILDSSRRTSPSALGSRSAANIRRWSRDTGSACIGSK